MTPVWNTPISPGFLNRKYLSSTPSAEGCFNAEELKRVSSVKYWWYLPRLDMIILKSVNDDACGQNWL